MKLRTFLGAFIFLSSILLLIKLLPKGENLVYVSSYSDSFSFFSSRYLLHLDTGREEGVTFLYPSKGHPMSWSPHGTWIASVESFEEEDHCCNVDIVFYNLSSFRTERLPIPSMQEDNPIWSTDGNWVVYEQDSVQGTIDGTKLMLMDVGCLEDGGNCDFTGSELVLGSDPDWSPISDQLLFIRNERVYILDLEGNKVEEIPLRLNNCRSPRWSPDGLLFVVDCKDEIYLSSLDGKSVVNLTNGVGKNSQPSWSPDGKNVLFLSTRNEMVGERIGDSGNLELNALFIVDINNGNLTQLTDSSDHIFWYSKVTSNPGLQLRLFLP